jgi:hypothetical protein
MTEPFTLEELSSIRSGAKAAAALGASYSIPPSDLLRLIAMAERLLDLGPVVEAHIEREKQAARIRERAKALTSADCEARYVVVDSWWELRAPGLPDVHASHLEDDDPGELGEAYVADSMRHHGWPLTALGSRRADDKERLEEADLAELEAMTKEGERR